MQGSNNVSNNEKNFDALMEELISLKKQLKHVHKQSTKLNQNRDRLMQRINHDHENLIEKDFAIFQMKNQIRNRQMEINLAKKRPYESEQKLALARIQQLDEECEVEAREAGAQTAELLHKNRDLKRDLLDERIRFEELVQRCEEYENLQKEFEKLEKVKEEMEAIKIVKRKKPKGTNRVVVDEISMQVDDDGLDEKGNSPKMECDEESQKLKELADILFERAKCGETICIYAEFPRVLRNGERIETSKLIITENKTGLYTIVIFDQEMYLSEPFTNVHGVSRDKLANSLIKIRMKDGQVFRFDVGNKKGVVSRLCDFKNTISVGHLAGPFFYSSSDN